MPQAGHGRNAGKGDLEFVEDEALIAAFVEDALSDGGFEACSVHSGEAALSTFRDGREGVGSC